MSFPNTKIFTIAIFFFAACGLKENRINIVEQKENQISVVQNSVQKTSNLEKQNQFLFQGKTIEIIEDIQNNFESTPFISKKSGDCIIDINKKVEKKFSDYSNKDTKYYIFEPQEKKESGNGEISSLTNRFVLRFNKEQFEKFNPDVLKKLDSAISFTGTNNLYYLKNERQSLLVAIGHNLASTGIGTAYFDYFIIPFNESEKTIEFSSVSNDPRTIKIGKSGLISYIQIDQNYYPRPAGALESELDYYPVIVKYFTNDEMSRVKLEFKFNCKSWESLSIFDE